MGNTGSLASNNPNSFELESILTRLSTSTIELTYHEIQFLFVPFNEEKLKCLAESIYDFGVRNFNFFGRDYIKLAQKFFYLEYQKTSMQRGTFKEILLKIVIDRFEDVFASGIYQSDTMKETAMIEFYANLFEAGIVSSTLVSHWMYFLNRKPDVERQFLLAIKPTVLREYSKIGHGDSNIIAFRAKLLEKGFIVMETPRQITTPGTIVPAPTNNTYTWNTTTPLEIKPTRPLVEESSSDSDYETFNQIDKRHTYVFNNFTHYMKNIKSNPKPNFNMQVFKTCSDEDRENCAEAMMSMVVANHGLVAEYANIAFEIRRTCMLNTQHHNTFGVFLIEECEHMVEEIFNESSLKWNKIAAVGSFLGHLYLNCCIKQVLLQDWISKTVEEVLKNNNAAVKPFLKTLKIILEQLKLKNPNYHKDCMRHLRTLVSQGRIPVEYRTWAYQSVGRSTADLGGSNNASVSSSPQRDTGAIRKTTQQPELLQTLQSSSQPVPTTSKAQKPCSQPQASATTQVCEEFQIYLYSLDELRLKRDGRTLLKSCPEKTLKGCALILLEHAATNPKNIELYANVTAHELLSNVSDPTKEIFVKHLSLYFEVEMNKWFKFESPEKSNWARINDVGLFLGELFNREVIEFPAVNLWIEGIFQLVLKECSPAFELLLRFLKIIALRLKNSNAPVFDIHMRQAEENFSNATISSQLNERTIMAELRNIQKQTSSDEEAAVASKMSISTHLAPTGDLFESLSVYTLADLKQHLDGMKLNKSGIKTFAFNFFDRIIKIKDFKFHSRLAQMIDSEISSKQPESEGSFKAFLLECLHKNVNSLKPFEAAKAVALEDRGVSAVRFIGEMFNLGMIENPWTMIESKLECYFELRLFSVMLETIGMKLQTKNDDGVLTAKLEMLKKNSATFKDMQRAFICEDLIGQLEHILYVAYNNVNNTVEAANLQRIKSAINDLKAENINKIVEEIQSVDIKNETQIHQIVKFIMEKMQTSCEDSKCLAQLVMKMQNLQVLHSFSFKEKLVEKCVETLIEIFQADISCSHHVKATGAIQFIIELFSLIDIGSETFELIIDAILENGSDNAFDQLNHILTQIGSKLDEEMKEKIDEYFEKFEAIANQEVSYRSTVLKQCMGLRKNNWIVAVPSKPITDATGAEDFINNTTNENIMVTVEAFKGLLNSDENKNVLFLSLWEAIINHPEQVKIHANLTNELSTETSFNEDFTEFLMCRVITMHPIPFGEYSDTTRQRLSKVMLFVGELYVLNFMSDETLASLLKPAKRLPYKTLAQLVALINSKVIQTESFHLKALMIYLDDIVFEGSLTVWKEVKDDLCEIETLIELQSKEDQ